MVVTQGIDQSNRSYFKLDDVSAGGAFIVGLPSVISYIFMLFISFLSLMNLWESADHLVLVSDRL